MSEGKEVRSPSAAANLIRHEKAYQFTVSRPIIIALQSCRSQVRDMERLSCRALSLRFRFISIYRCCPRAEYRCDDVPSIKRECLPMTNAMSLAALSHTSPSAPLHAWWLWFAQASLSNSILWLRASRTNTTRTRLQPDHVAPSGRPQHACRESKRQR